MKRLLHALLSISMILAFTATFVPTAHSVIQNVTVTGPGGAPIGRQTVKINFPPGVTVDGKDHATQETDDDGVLIFDFPGDGEYRIDHDDGSMMVVVKGGIPTWVKVGGGLAVIGGIWYAADDNGGGNGNSGNNSNGGSNTNGGNGATNGGNGATNGGNGATNGGNGATNGGNGATNGGNGGDASGEYDTVTFTVTSNPANHPPGPFQSARYTVTKNLDTGAIEILVQGSGATATLNGTCDEDGNFNVSGSGTYSGFSTTFSMSGTFNVSGGTVSFTISGGNDGGLPMGEPIVGDGTAEK